MSFYENLGVEKDATEDQIKKAYRKMAAVHHPDKHGGSNEEFLKVQKAYDVLSDPEQRKRYDETGEEEPPKFIPEIEVAEIFAQIIDQGLDPKRNLLESVKKSVELGMTELAQRQGDAQRKSERYREAARRLKFAKSKLIHETLEAKATGQDSISARIAAQIKVGKSLQELLGGMSYESDNEMDFDSSLASFEELLRNVKPRK